MRRAAFLACLLALAGCQSTLQLDSPRGTPQATPGTRYSGGALDMRATSGSVAGALIGLGLIAVTIHGGTPDRSSATPALDPARSISEQDCTRPLEPSGGNLRCR